MLRLTVWICGM